MNNRKYPKRGGPAKALAVAVGKVTKPIFGKRGFADGAIVNDWSTIVGPDLSTHSAPSRITYPMHETSAGTLHLRIDNSGLGLALQHQQPVLIERINGYFGFNAVANIKITQGPLPARPVTTEKALPPLTADDKATVAKSLQGVEDDDLGNALQALGHAVIGLRKSENN